MDSALDVRNHIKSLDEKLLRLCTTEHDQLTQPLASFTESIATINNLMHIAVNHEDFVFADHIHEKYKADAHPTKDTSREALVQIARKALETLESTFELFMEVRAAVTQILDVLPDVLTNTTVDPNTSIEIADAIVSHAEVCESFTKCAADKYILVLKMIDQDFVALSCTKLSDPTKQPISDTCTEALTSLNILKNKWTDVTKFVWQFASYVRNDLRGDSSEFRSASYSTHSLAQRKNFARKAVKMCTTPIHALAVIQSYIEVFELFRPIIHDTQQAILGKANDRFLKLEAECQKIDKNTIKQIAEAKKQEMLTKIKESLEMLKAGEGGGQYNKVMRSMVIGEGANEVAIKHVELETLLAAAPDSILSLSQLCLISTTTKDFQLQPPITGYQFATSNWFRACLLQVMNKGSLSFASASKNLAQIETLSCNIPGSVMDIFNLIVNGELDDIEHMLPDMLSSIVQTGGKCNTLAMEVAQQFTSMVDLINEIKVSCTATRSVAETSSAKPDTVNCLGISQVDSDKIIAVLMDGLKALIKIQMQWNKLIRFFDELTKLIRLEMLEPMESFQRMVEESAESRMKRRKAVSAWVKDTLRDRAQDLAQKGCEVHMVTTMYLNISKNHVQGPLLTLDSLLAITDAKEAERIQSTLTEKCNRSQREISKMAKRHKVESFATMRKKMREIERKGKEVVGEVTEDDYDDYDDDEDDYARNDDGGEGGDGGESSAAKEAYEDMMVELEIAKLTEEVTGEKA